MKELELELRFKLILYNRLLLDFEQNVSESRSSHQKCSIKKDVLKNFANFTRKHLCQSLFLNKDLLLETENE